MKQIDIISDHDHVQPHASFLNSVSDKPFGRLVGFVTGWGFEGRRPRRGRQCRRCSRRSLCLAAEEGAVSMRDGWRLGVGDEAMIW